MNNLIRNVGGVLESEATRAYNSFSGSDIRAQIGPYPFAEIQAVSYSVTREKAPIYTMGSPDVRAYSRNKRGIAGTLIWINFDRHALLNVIRKASGRFLANVDDLRPEYRADNVGELAQDAIFKSTIVRANDATPSASATLISDLQQELSAVSGFKQPSLPWYSDQILPFDITLAGSNEVGAACAMKIYGCEILNEGSGISIDDAVQEMQATFVARIVEPWQAVKGPDFGQATVGGGLKSV